MTDLLFIRHAETDLAGTFCGRSDPPVNAAGRRQIQELVESLHSEKIRVVYSSDLQRAVTTAHALAEFMNVPLVTRAALCEIGFGRWEGLTWRQIEELDSSYATRWLNEFPRLSAPQGESIEHFEARVLGETSFLRSQSRFEDKTIAVVTHAGVMRSALRNLCGIKDSEAWMRTKSYCSTFRYRYAGSVFQEELQR